MKHDRSGRRVISRSAIRCLAPLVVILALVSGNIQAAPVTLQFDAVVGSPRQGVLGPVPPNWNISLQQGDTISGAFTFEPFDAPSDSSKTEFVVPFNFSIQIKSHSLTTSLYRIEVANNVLYIDDDDRQPDDSIRMGCSFFGGPSVCTPRTISFLDSTEWAFEITLGGKFDVLDGADIPFDPWVWQQFNYYGLVLTFVDRAANRYYGFSAVPQSFRVVPEPDKSSILWLSMSIVFCTRCIRQRDRRNET